MLFQEIDYLVVSWITASTRHFFRHLMSKETPCRRRNPTYDKVVYNIFVLPVDAVGKRVLSTGTPHRLASDENLAPKETVVPCPYRLRFR
jgi:hypothetical protein